LSLVSTALKVKAMQAEIEFENKLRNLLSEYDKNLEDVIFTLSSFEELQNSTVVEGNFLKKGRMLRTYQNPYTGQIVKTVACNKRLLRCWKDEFGGDVVKRWLV
jgi:hypothetical protein